MISINVSHDLDKLVRAIDRLARDQLPFAIASALTKTAQSAQRAIPAALEKALDRPTEFTKRGTFITKARKNTLTAVVGFKDIQAEYLRYQIEGGTRAPKKVALRLPGNVVLDQYGNLPRGTIAKLLAAAKAGKYGAAVSRRLGIGNRRKQPGEVSLFYGQPKGHPGLPVGIWRRVPGAPGKITPVIVFPRRSARYKPRFKFGAMVDSIVRSDFPAEFNAAYTEAVRTAR